jgi:diacylglycerol kinase (ATP)
MNYAFILNPAANNDKNRRRGSLIEAHLRREYPTALIVHSEKKGDITTQASKLSQSHEVVIVCGGDGSLNELIEGLRGSTSIGGVIPSGSGNDFSRGLGLSLIPAHEIVAIRQRIVVDIDTVEISVDGARSIFQNTLGIGFDGWANHFALSITFPTGKLKYLVAALKSIWWHKIQRFELVIDGQSEQCDALMITLANGGVEGGGFYVAPNARPDDGLLDVVIVKPISKFGLLCRLPFLMFRKQPAFRAIVRRRCRHIVINCNDTMAAHADGENLGLHIKSIEARVLHRAVRFLVPSTLAFKH